MTYNVLKPLESDDTLAPSFLEPMTYNVLKHGVQGQQGQQKLLEPMTYNVLKLEQKIKSMV